MGRDKDDGSERLLLAKEVLKMVEKTGVRFDTVFLNENPPDDDGIEQLICWGKRFYQLGITSGSAGNLSFRTKDGFVVTGSGFGLDNLENEHFVEVVNEEITNGQIVVYAKGKVIPSKESVFHWEIYQLRAEINAVFHAHDQMVLESADEVNVPCTKREHPRGSYEQAKEVKELLSLARGVRYLVLKNHGIVSTGETIEEAGRLAEYMNKRARQTKEGGKNEDDARL